MVYFNFWSFYIWTLHAVFLVNTIITWLSPVPPCRQCHPLFVNRLLPGFTWVEPILCLVKVQHPVCTVKVHHPCWCRWPQRKWNRCAPPPPTIPFHKSYWQCVKVYIFQYQRTSYNCFWFDTNGFFAAEREIPSTGSAATWRNRTRNQFSHHKLLWFPSAQIFHQKHFHQKHLRTGSFYDSGLLAGFQPSNFF